MATAQGPRHDMERLCPGICTTCMDELACKYTRFSLQLTKRVNDGGHVLEAVTEVVGIVDSGHPVYACLADEKLLRALQVIVAQNVSHRQHNRLYVNGALNDATEKTRESSQRRGQAVIATAV